MSRSRLVAYWVTTGLVASSMLSAGAAHYPLRFVTLGEPISPKTAT